MLIKIIIKCNFLVVLLGLFLSITNNLKAEGNEFSMGVGFEPQAVTVISEMSPLRLGDFIRTSPYNGQVSFFLSSSIAGGSVTLIDPTGYYTLQEGSSGTGIYAIVGNPNTLVNLSLPADLDSIPPGITAWQWMGQQGQFILDLNGFYYYRLGLRVVLPANSTLSGTITRRFTLEATGG